MRRLLDDLFELRAFLLQRGAELSAGGDQAVSTSAPEVVQQVAASDVTGMLAGLEGALSMLTSARTKQLLAIKTSRRFLLRMVHSLNQQAGKELKFQRHGFAAVLPSITAWGAGLCVCSLLEISFCSSRCMSFGRSSGSA
jgi:CDK5 regulatory subunit-associated protein 3